MSVGRKSRRLPKDNVTGLAIRDGAITYNELMKKPRESSMASVKCTVSRQNTKKKRKLFTSRTYQLSAA